MYKCEVCGTQVPRGIRQKKRVSRKRARTYSQAWVRVRNSKARRDSHVFRNLPRTKDGGRRKGQPRFIEILIPLHTGWEIAEEVRICPACFGKG